METSVVRKTSEHEIAWNTVSLHDKICYLIKNGKQNQQNMLGVTPLFLACQAGSVEDVTLLLQAQAAVNLETHAGRIPLHVAASGGYIEIVELLLVAGSDIYWKDAKGYTPLQLAQEKGHNEIVNLLQTQIELDREYNRKARLAKRRSS
jgi:ankyrin repeat protein